MALCGELAQGFSCCIVFIAVSSPFQRNKISLVIILLSVIIIQSIHPPISLPRIIQLTRVACTRNVAFVAKKLLLHNSVGLIFTGDGAAAAGPHRSRPRCARGPRGSARDVKRRKTRHFLPRVRAVSCTERPRVLPLKRSCPIGEYGD